MLPEVTLMPLDFLRPLWLLGLLAILLFSVLRYKNSKSANEQSLIAAHLSTNLVTSATHSTKRDFSAIALAVIACIALSGPTWRSIDMPVYEMEKAQVIVFDLSYSMFATDIKPNRLSQAKFKAIDLIKQWSEGEKALIAYAGDAFTITPLTRDGNAIINHIPHLSPDIMPVRGSRADLALDKAIVLLKNAGYSQGHIVFISDAIDETQAQQMQDTLKGENWIVSILAMATTKGAPITLSDGSLLKTNSGEIIVPKLVGQPFYDIASAANGLYLTSQNDSSDIQKLGRFYEDINQNKTQDNKTEQGNSDQFSIDDGYWLSFLLIPLFLLLFRKGVFVALLFAVSLPFSSPPLQAAEPTPAQASIWRNSDQNAYQAYQNNNYQLASELYDSPLEQGSALYKNKQYDQALEQYTKATIAQPNNANAFYNQGNSYAQLQQFDKAIDAYDKALGIDPNMQLAKQNKSLVEQIKEQQQQDQQDSSQDDQQDSEQEQKDADQDQKNSEQEQKDSQQNQQDSEQEQEQEQNNSEQEQQSEQQKQDEQQKQAEEQQQQAEKQAEQDETEPEEQVQQTELSESDQDVNEELEALPNWLKNMPDDPSILLRRKMQLEYQKRAQSQPVKQQTNNGVIW